MPSRRPPGATAAAASASQVLPPDVAERRGGFGTQAASVLEAATSAAPVDADLPCKFFGSAKGCSSGDDCQFSHDFPNSVPPCTFKQKGGCLREDSCHFRHIPWSSREQAEEYYEARAPGTAGLAAVRFRQVRNQAAAQTGDSGGSARAGSMPEPAAVMPAATRVAAIAAAGGTSGVERRLQAQTYGDKAVRMMEKMGYVYGAGHGLGREGHGSTRLAAPCAAIGRSARSAALGFGIFEEHAAAARQEREAAEATRRYRKRPRQEGASFVVHALLSSDEDSEVEDQLVQRVDVQLGIPLSP